MIGMLFIAALVLFAFSGIAVEALLARRLRRKAVRARERREARLRHPGRLGPPEAEETFLTLDEEVAFADITRALGRDRSGRRPQ